MNFNENGSDAEIVKLLEELYQSILGRYCDQSGLETYGRLLREGRTLNEISEVLKSSEEFTSRAYRNSSQLEALRHLVVEFVTPVDATPGRICYILHNSLPQASGGYATRSHGLGSALAKRGYEVLAITRPGFPHDMEGAAEFDGGVVLHVGVAGDRITVLPNACDNGEYLLSQFAHQ